MNRRQQQLTDLVDDLIRVHNEWAESGEARPDPDAIYWDAVDAVFLAFEHGDIPEACRQQFLAVERLREAHDEFQNEADEKNQYPGDHFWEAIDALKHTRTARAKRELPPLESMQELLALPNMSREQVAKIYGLVDANGNPQAHLVQKELDKPGGVINEKWVDPRLKLMQQQEDAVADLHQELLERKTKANAAKDVPCPETPEELHDQGVSVDQASRMLKRPAAEVAKLFKEFDAKRDAERRTAVLEMSREGSEPKEIAKELGLSQDAVKRIILAANEEEKTAAGAAK